jgi:SAM-dependent methyltransferase
VPAVLDAQGLYARPRDVRHVENCFFYHVMDLPGFGVVGGSWDLREGVDTYLGRVDVAGKRVLEVGPASGFLTVHLESRGAEVVAEELGDQEEWEIAPHHQLRNERVQANRFRHRERLRNSFWLTHRVFGLSARVHYGNAYTLPPELGRFDVAILASVLLHTRDPLRIVQRCADVTDETLVIVDRHDPALDGAPVCRLMLSPEKVVSDIWWTLSPDLLVQFLGVLGFPNVEVTFHQQPYRPDPAVPEPVPIDLFTVVGRRG